MEVEVTDVSNTRNANVALVPGGGSGEILALSDGLSFWGGVDPETGIIIDAHHPDAGACVSGKVLLMPTSRGSCSGSGVLLELALSRIAPAALVFSEDEEILTLGALVADRIFGCGIPVFRLSHNDCQLLAAEESALVSDEDIRAGALVIPLRKTGVSDVELTERDTRLLAGEQGAASALAMEVIVRMAVAQGAPRLLDVTRGHIDGCILAHSANLIFAERMLEMGAKVAIPTTINAISVDRCNWQSQGLDTDFGDRASRLADAYVNMGARPTFTCSPYLLDDVPAKGECLGWSESNAVIYANSVLGARTAKHPDYFDLFVAMTGRAPAIGMYCDEGRVPGRVLRIELPTGADESFWPLLGWAAGKASPDRVPLLVGLENASASRDDLKAFSAAFGSTSGAPMFHIAGQTPESDQDPSPQAHTEIIGRAELASAWRELNSQETGIDLVAIGSPHVSLTELRQLADAFEGHHVHPDVDVIVTVGRDVLEDSRKAGDTARLEEAGVKIYPDICWCSITEPVFPKTARTLMTNSGKYAHYATGLTGRHARFGTVSDCVRAALTGRVSSHMPEWLR